MDNYSEHVVNGNNQNQDERDGMGMSFYESVAINMFKNIRDRSVIAVDPKSEIDPTEKVNL